MHHEDDIWAAIERVLAGDATPEDELLVSRWTREDAANEAELRRLEAAWQIASSSGRTYDSRSAWAQLQSRLSSDAGQLGPASAAPGQAGRAPADSASAAPAADTGARFRRRALRPAALMWAATLALVIGGGVIVSRVLPHAADAPSLMARQVTTGIGQRATVRLGDGSVVVLGPRSTLAEVENTDGERRIELSGSAYFDVVHDAAHPFVVAVGTAETRVLGTTFSVRGYADGTPVEAVVQSGRVSLRAHAAHGAVVLTAGQMGRIEADGTVSVRTNVDVAAQLSWRDGTLLFEGAPLSEVAATLERWYRIEITIADSTIATYPLTATFRDASLSDVLTVVSRTLGVRHSFDGSSAEFHP